MALDISLLNALTSFSLKLPLIDAAIIFCASTLAYLLCALFFVFLFTQRSTRHSKREIGSVALLTVCIARLGVVDLIHVFYQRPRPYIDLPVPHLLSETTWSFPSGHATFFFALSTIVYLYNKQWGMDFFALTTLITIARVAAGVHYPSDIIGGLICGVCTAYFIYAGMQFLHFNRVHQTS